LVAYFSKYFCLPINQYPNITEIIGLKFSVWHTAVCQLYDE
jgi:hypothetical protein